MMVWMLAVSQKSAKMAKNHEEWIGLGARNDE